MNIKIVIGILLIVLAIFLPFVGIPLLIIYILISLFGGGIKLFDGMVKNKKRNNIIETYESAGVMCNPNTGGIVDINPDLFVEWVKINCETHEEKFNAVSSLWQDIKKSYKYNNITLEQYKNNEYNKNVIMAKLGMLNENGLKNAGLEDIIQEK